MKIKHLKLLVTANTMGAALLIAWAGAIVLNGNGSDRMGRTDPWSPSAELLAERPAPQDRTFQLTEALARPLFRSTRRPFVPSVEPPLNEPTPPPDAAEAADPPPPAYDPTRLVLKGVWQLGHKTKALIGSDESPEGVWLEPGATISGWTITSLDPDGATLASGKIDFRLKLYVDKSPN